MEMVDEMPPGASIHFESTDEEDHHCISNLFDDQPDGMGLVVNPRSMLRMRRSYGLTCDTS